MAQADSERVGKKKQRQGGRECTTARNKKTCGTSTHKRDDSFIS